MEWTPSRIRLLRTAGPCLSQQGFVTALGFAKRTIGNAERGTHPLSLAVRRALDQALEQLSDAQRERFFAALATDHGTHPVVHLTTAALGSVEPLRQTEASDLGPGVLDPVLDQMEELFERLGVEQFPVVPPAKRPTAYTVEQAEELLAHLRALWHLLVKTDNPLGPRYALSGVLPPGHLSGRRSECYWTESSCSTKRCRAHHTHVRRHRCAGSAWLRARR